MAFLECVISSRKSAHEPKATWMLSGNTASVSWLHPAKHSSPNVVNRVGITTSVSEEQFWNTTRSSTSSPLGNRTLHKFLHPAKQP